MYGQGSRQNLFPHFENLKISNKFKFALFSETVRDWTKFEDRMRCLCSRKTFLKNNSRIRSLITTGMRCFVHWRKKG